MTLHDPLPAPARPPLAARLAGGGLVALGAVLAALGVVGLVSIQLVVSTGGALSLVAAGLGCAVFGVLVWRGSRLATAVALVGLLCLVVVQASSVLGTPAPESGDLARLALTIVLAGLLGIAARAR